MRNRWMGCLSGMAMMLAMAACEPIDQTSKVASQMAKKTVDNTRSYWADLFTARDHTPQLPQTRYCYQMQSDVVCYDSAQSGLNSKLVGYQDGDAVGWIQPGGGSVGASGGAPVALKQRPPEPNYGARQGESYAIRTTSMVNVPGAGEIMSGNLAPVK